MDFAEKWPIGRTWAGYLQRAPCMDCDAEGKINGAWCKRCEGEKDYRIITHPPTGDGFQMWETVTEGSPQSPVFATLKELCAWLEPNASWFADMKTSAAEWEHCLSRNTGMLPMFTLRE